jgi:uncharacterized membrane protein YgaE (UPF0421/DUF939 family)
VITPFHKITGVSSSIPRPTHTEKIRNMQVPNGEVPDVHTIRIMPKGSIQMTGSKIKTLFFEYANVWKTALAAGLAFEIAQLTGTKHPYFAPLAAILCVQITIDKSIKSGYNRIIGTVIGVLLTAFISGLIGVHGWSIGLIVLIGTLIGRLAGLGESAVYQVGISAMMVLLFEAKSHSYAFDRVFETLIGAFIAIIINMLIFPPDLTRDAKEAYNMLSDNLAKCFYRTGEWIDYHCEVAKGEKLRQDTRALLLHLHDVLTKSEQAENSLKFNPFRQNHRNRLHDVREKLLLTQRTYNHLVSIVRTFHHWSQSDRFIVELYEPWADRMRYIGDMIQSRKAEAKSVKIEEKMESYETNNEIGMALPQEIRSYTFTMAVYNDTTQLMREFQLGGGEHREGNAVPVGHAPGNV